MKQEAVALRELASPWGNGEKVKTAINRAARLSGLSYWRAFDIWYGKARRVEDFEREQIAAALQAKQEEEARNEFHQLKTRLAILEARLLSGDPDFHSPTVAALRQSVCKRG